MYRDCLSPISLIIITVYAHLKNTSDVLVFLKYEYARGRERGKGEAGREEQERRGKGRNQTRPTHTAERGAHTETQVSQQPANLLFLSYCKFASTTSLKSNFLKDVRTLPGRENDGPPGPGASILGVGPPC